MRKSNKFAQKLKPVYKNVNSIYWLAYVFETSKPCNMGLEVSHSMSTVDCNYNNREFSLLLPAMGSHNLFFDAGKDHIVPLVYQDMKGSEGTPLTPATSSLTYSGLIR